MIITQATFGVRRPMSTTFVAIFKGYNFVVYTKIKFEEEEGQKCIIRKKEFGQTNTRKRKGEGTMLPHQRSTKWRNEEEWPAHLQLGEQAQLWEEGQTWGASTRRGDHFVLSYIYVVMSKLISCPSLVAKNHKSHFSRSRAAVIYVLG